MAAKRLQGSVTGQERVEEAKEKDVLPIRSTADNSETGIQDLGRRPTTPRSSTRGHASSRCGGGATSGSDEQTKGTLSRRTEANRVSYVP